jgi:hypothetical protein
VAVFGIFHSREKIPRSIARFCGDRFRGNALTTTVVSELKMTTLRNAISSRAWMSDAQMSEDAPAAFITPSETEDPVVLTMNTDAVVGILQAMPSAISLIRPAIMQDPDRAPARSRSLRFPADHSFRICPDLILCLYQTIRFHTNFDGSLCLQPGQFTVSGLFELELWTSRWRQACLSHIPLIGYAMHKDTASTAPLQSNLPASHACNTRETSLMNRSRFSFRSSHCCARNHNHGCSHVWRHVCISSRVPLSYPGRSVHPI